MHPQLEILLELQDLKAQKREMEATAEESSRDIEADVFQVRPEDAIEQLAQKIAEIESSLEGAIAKRYQLLASRNSRPVVPVINGVCYGCFMSMPTSTGSSHAEIRWCENCGAFVYFVD